MPARDCDKRGPREGMTPPQVALLVDILLKSSAPWAVPLMLLQKMTGERCGRMTRARVRWLDLISCRLTIEKVTGKTQERSIALTPWVRDLVEHWLLERPLLGADRGDGVPTRWPFPDQPLDADACLFPGQEQGQGRYMGNLRRWYTPVTTRGYLKRIREAGEVIREQRALSHSVGDEHPFDGFKLEKLGTHSFKYTGVSLMKDVSRSTALVGAVAGTSAKTLDRIYDSATIPRQLTMVGQAFRNLRGELRANPMVEAIFAHGRAEPQR